MIPAPPKDPALNRLYRAWLLRRCRDDAACQRRVLDRCRDDIVFYIDSTVFQFNPWELDNEVGPFILFPRQEEALLRTLHRLLVARRPALWEKSRYQGATWLLVIAQDWLAKFKKHKHPFTISHSEQAVDSPGSPNTLYYKVRFINDHQPAWLTRGVKKRKLSFSYPATDSTYTGSATSKLSGVGGRSPLVGVDEFSKHTKARDILGQTAYTGPCWFIGTHYPEGDVFAELCDRPDMFKEILHWSQNPLCNRGLYRSDPNLKDWERPIDKDYPFPPDYKFVRDGTPVGTPDGVFDGLRSVWYDQMCEDLKDSRLVAMHLDINRKGSAEQFFDPMTLRRLIAQTCYPPEWQGELQYGPMTGELTGLEEEKGGPLKLWLAPLGPLELPPGDYGAGCDIGGDRSASVCSVGDARTGRKVAELVTTGLPPEQFAAAVMALLGLFKNAHAQTAVVCWETNGPGGHFGRTLMRLGYRRLYERPTYNIKRVMTGKVPGWNSQGQPKKDLLLAYRGALRSGALINPSELALEECGHYRTSEKRDTIEHPKDVQSGNTHPSATRSFHGDRVIADAIMWMVLQSLGAGQPRQAPPPLETPALVGSTAWRYQLAQQEERDGRRRHPIRWAGAPT